MNLVLQMITREHLSEAVFSACMLINFCDVVWIYSPQPEIKLKMYSCFPMVQSQFSESDFVFITWVLLPKLSDIPDFWIRCEN